MTTIIIIILAALLVAFAIYNTIKKARGKSKSSCCGTPEVKTVKKVSDTDESHYPFRYEVGIGEMHCSNCARAVENQLNSLDGVWANVDLGRSRALVRSKQELTEEDITSALSETPYTLLKYRATT